MNKFFTKFVVGAVALAFSVPNANAQTTFNPSSGNYYRIPSIVRLPTGYLWAISDLRIGGNGDIGNSNRVDIAGRLGLLKEDNTYNWGNETVLLAGDANATEDFKYAYGDAASVVDRESGKVLLMTCAGKEGVNSTNDGFPLVARSVFDNNTWSTTNVTNQLYGTNNLFGVHLFVSSGRIIQSTIYKKKDYYRIYAGVCSVKSATVPSRGSRVIYSDDFGVTWNYLGGYDAMPVDIGNECKIEELPDGSILLNTRTNAAPLFGRHMNIFKFTDIANGKGSWQSQYVTSGASNISGQTYAPDCNAEILLVPAKRTSDNVQTYLLLLSAPTVMPGRKNVCIYWKELPTEYTNLSNYVNGWTKHPVDGGKYCGYSTMVLDKNGNIAFLTENTAWNGPITFKSLSLKDITDNAYSYSPSTPGTYHTTSEPTWEHGVGGIVKPTMSLAGGTYANSQTITLTATDDAQIYYTLDGSEPQVPTTTTGSGVAPLCAGTTTTGTQRYTDPITLSEGTTTLKALAVDNNGNKSQTVTSTYTILGSKSKTGTTITLDHKSSKALYTNGGQNFSEFAYLRHNSTHIQLLSSTYAKLKKGEQVFKYAANNMDWTDGDSLLILRNGRDTTTYRLVTQYAHYAILAPKGYRFLRYEIVLTSGSQEGGKLEEYTYKDGSDSEINILGGTASATASATHDVTLSRTLEKATNVLYFRQDKISPGQINGKTEELHVKSIKLIYAIDNAFDETIPNNNGTGFHSGFIDFGTLSQKDKTRNYGFNSNPTDLEYFNVKDPNGSTPNTVSVDNSNYFVASTVGDYYVEAPTKFRIVGATIKLKRASSGTFGIYTPSEATHGVPIVLGASTTEGNSTNTESSGNYLKIDDSGNFTNVKSLDQATVFTVDYHSDANGGNGENRYSLRLPNGKYLAMNSTPALVITDNVSLWSYNSGWKFPYAKNNKNEDQYKFIGAWKDDSYAWGIKGMWQRAAIPYTKPIAAANFNAKVANPDGNLPDPYTFVSDASNSEASYNVDNLNNDAIKIHFDNIGNGEAALFNVQLKVIPLNPEVETIEAAAIPSDKSAAEGNSPVTSENYVFNHGNVINVPVTVGTKTANMVFRNAHNEELTNWYTGTNTNGASETGSYSNLYLIGSTADQVDKWNTATPSPSARVDVDQIGTTQITATNMNKLAEETQKAIKGLSTQPMTLQDNTVDAKTANYQTVTLDVGSKDEPTTYYLYSADRPTNEIMPEDIRLGQHIDFRFYSIRVKPVEAEIPLIEIVPLYTSTMKGRQNKTDIASDGTELNTKDKYVGIKVTSQLNDGVTGSVKGYLTAEAIEEAMKTALNNSEYQSPHVGDPLRNVLYVDMSSLTTVTTANSTTMAEYASATADNCLFFMPIGFAATNMANTIAKQSDGTTYQAIGDVKVYDQQPFFTPHSFTTGQFKASYTRESTNSKALVRKMASVLPFHITLDAGGHPYLNGETNPRSNITFYNITGYGKVTGVKKNQTDHELTYAVVAEKVSTLKAEANKPYYVSKEESEPSGFEFSIPNATFEETPYDKNGSTVDPDKLLNENGTWTAHGTYNGVAPTKSDYLWYVSKELFWKSGQLTTFDVVNVRPFRAYYITKDETPKEAKAGVVYDPSEITPTGISEVQTVHVNNGRVYTIDGRYVGTSLDNLAPGLYIQNGRKVVKQ